MNRGKNTPTYCIEILPNNVQNPRLYQYMDPRTVQYDSASKVFEPHVLFPSETIMTLTNIVLIKTV